MKRNIICFLLSLFISQVIGSAILGDTPIDSVCQDHADCVGEPDISSECIVREGEDEAKCTCKETFIPKSDNLDCLPLAQTIGADCVEPDQCIKGLPGNYSDCVDSICECTDESLHIPPVHVCLKKAELIGESCYFDGQCTANLENTHCPTEGVCTCSAGFVSSENLRRCLPIVNELRGNCEESDQCKKGVIGEHSECTSDPKVCQCNSDGIEIPGSNVCFRKATLIGDNCLHPEQCTENLGDLSECAGDNKCTCLTGAVGNGAGDKCLEADIPIGDECEDDAQCFGESKCMSNICACDPASHVPKEDGSDCLPIQNELGGECQENLQCQAGVPGDHSTCATGNCACTDDALEMNGSNFCFPKATKLGDDCLHPQQCTANLGELSECSVDDKCSCQTGAVGNRAGDKCLLANVPIGDGCEETVQCSGSSTCNSNICACNPFQVPKEDKLDCLPIQNNLNGTCEESAQCQAGNPGRHSECLEGLCKCNSDGVEVPGQPFCFLKASLIGDFCLHTEQCTANLGELSECSVDVSICACKSDAIGNGDRSKCLLANVPIGNGCEEDLQCQGRSTCRSNICACNLASEVPNEAKSECIPIQNDLHGECQESIQCQAGSPGRYAECTDDLCKCTDEGIEIPPAQMCFRKATQVGDHCLFPEQCTTNLGELSECSTEESTCVCKPDAVGSGDGSKCLLANIPIGDACDEDVQCSGSSTCRSNICACNLATEVPNEANTDCLPIRNELNQPCQENIQCQAGRPGRYAECINDLCKCTNEGVEVPDQHMCFPRASLIGDFCLYPEQCKANLGDLSECTAEEECSCSPGAIEGRNKDKCLPTNVPIGDECEEEEQCSGRSSCRENICACDLATEVPNEAKSDCLPIQNALHGECQETIQCQAGLPGRYANCVGNTCQCNNEGLEVPGEPFCFRKATQVGDHCIHQQQCTTNLGELSECSTDDNECVCKSDAVENGDKSKCLTANVPIGNECEDDAQCVGSSSCRTNICSCNPFQVPKEDNSDCLSIQNDLNGECEEDLQCQAGNPGRYSVCSESLCKCNDEGLEIPGLPMCLKKATHIGDHCIRPEQCTTNLGELSECSENDNCSCSTGAVGNGEGNKCLLANIPIGEGCEETVQCSGSSTCNSNVCACNPFQVPKEDNSDCLPIQNNLNGTCEESAQCQAGNPGRHSDCLEGLCKCNSDGVEVPGQPFCFLKASLIGDFCLHPEQCTANLGELSECTDEDKCSCSSGAIEGRNRDKCLPTNVPIGDECEEEEQCSGRSSCKSNICSCNLASEVPKEDKSDCLPIQNDLNGPCLENLQCQAGTPGRYAECIDELCKCNNAGVEVPGQQICFPRASLIGDFCLHPEQCTANLGELSECTADNNCTCVEGAVGNAANNKCFRPNFIPLGGKCEDDVECVGSSDCIKDICACNPARDIPNHDNTTCLPIQNSLHGDCQETAQCQAGTPGRYSNCTTAGKCNCTDEGIEISGSHMCFPKATKLYDTCLHPEQCTSKLGAVSECSADNVCTCIKETVPKLDNSTCLTIQNNLRGDCQEPAQCQAGLPGAFSTCTLGKCACTADGVENSGSHVCFRKANKLYEECLHPQQCESNLGNLTECTANNICSCQTLTVPKLDNSTCLEKAGYAEACEQTSQCLYDLGEHAECTEEICTCEHNSIFHADKCRGETKLDGACTEDDDCIAHISGGTSCVENLCVCNAGLEQDGEKACSGQVKIGGLYLLNFILFAVTILNYFK